MRYGVALRAAVVASPKDTYVFWLCYDLNGHEQRWFPTQEIAQKVLEGYLGEAGVDEGYTEDEFVVVKVPEHLVKDNLLPANIDTTPNGRVCYDPLGILTNKKYATKSASAHTDAHDQGLF